MDVNVVLFDDFDSMDVFGPAQIFGKLQKHYNLRYLSVSGDIINSAQGCKIWTDYLVPEEIEGVLLIPGGKGARRLLWHDERTLEILKRAASHAEVCLMVGNGTGLIAQTGILYRRKLADCPYDKNWNRMFMAGFERIEGSKVVADGKFFSCSSTAAALDMTLWMISDQIDIDVAAEAAEQIGYSWNPDNGEQIYC